MQTTQQTSTLEQWKHEIKRLNRLAKDQTLTVEQLLAIDSQQEEAMFQIAIELKLTGLDYYERRLSNEQWNKVIDYLETT